MKVTIIGAGGIGTNLVRPLSRILEYGDHEGEHELTIVDGDVIEFKNLERQDFAATHIGGNKSEVLASQIISFEKPTRVNVSFIDEFIREDNASEILEEESFVFLCVDNHKTRKLVNDAVKKLSNIVLISGGNELETGQAQLYIRQGGQDITHDLTAVHPEVENPTDQHPDEISCEETIETVPTKAEQTILANVMAASFMMTMFRSATDFLGGKEIESIPEEIVFNINGNASVLISKRMEIKDANLEVQV